MKLPGVPMLPRPSKQYQGPPRAKGAVCEAGTPGIVIGQAAPDALSASVSNQLAQDAKTM